MGGKVAYAQLLNDASEIAVEIKGLRGGMSVEEIYRTALEHNAPPNVILNALESFTRPPKWYKGDWKKWKAEVDAVKARVFPPAGGKGVVAPWEEGAQ